MGTYDERPTYWEQQALLRNVDGNYAWSRSELHKICGMPVIEARLIRLEAQCERGIQCIYNELYGI